MHSEESTFPTTNEPHLSPDQRNVIFKDELLLYKLPSIMTLEVRWAVV